MANVQVANVHEYIIGHDLLAGNTLVIGSKYSFKVHISLWEKWLHFLPLELPSKQVTSKQYRLPRGYIEITQMITAVRSWSYSEPILPLQQPQ